jgi:hypothetical protein
MSELHGSLTPPAVADADMSGNSTDPIALLHSIAQQLLNETPAIRMWELLHRVEDNLRSMSREELRGALLVLGPMSAYLNRIYFEEHTEFSRKSLVKTVDELFEIAIETEIHRDQEEEGAQQQQG